MALSKKERDALPDEMFAVPGKRVLPFPDEEHTKVAWDMVDRTKGLTDAERAEARRRVLKRAKELGIDTSAWQASFEHVRLSGFASLGAMSLHVPESDGHPNRMPFSGVMTFVDTPSDWAVGGTGGKKTYLPCAVAEKALPSLLGMAIDFTPGFDGHDPERKIGLITGADIIGREIQIKGFFYAADFPAECQRIRQEKEALGFSYEFMGHLEPMSDTVDRIVSGAFTGAAVLYKNKAAYQSTSLAAQRAELEVSMTKEELQALLAESVSPIATQLAELGKDVAALKAKGADPLQANKDMVERVAPHVQSLKNCAAAMEAAGMGLHSDRGHVRFLRHMAASMEADAAEGRVPHIYRDHDWMFHSGEIRQPRPTEPSPELKAVETKLAAALEGLEKLSTTITDLKASAFQNSPAPPRKTLPSEITSLLAKGHLTEDQTKSGVTERELDGIFDKAGITDRGQRIATKLAASAAGLLKAA